MITAARPVPRYGVDHGDVIGSQPRQIRLMVVDDHPSVRLGLEQLLDGQRNFSVATGECAPPPMIERADYG